MKKKAIFAILLSFVLLCGCAQGSQEEVATSEKTTEVVEESEPELEEAEPEVEEIVEETVTVTELPYGQEIGEGIMYVSTPSGTSEDGNVPVLLETEDIVMDMIGLNAFEMDGSLWSFIYIDGVFVEKNQLADTSMSLTIEGDHLAAGEHIVSVVQYDTNDESGEIITYKEAKYKIEY